MEEKRRPIKKWVYWFLFAVAVIAVYKTMDNFNEIIVFFKNLFGILMPFIIGALLAYLLYVPCKKVESAVKKSKFKFVRKRARGISILIVYVILFLILIIAINFILPPIAKSLIDLYNNLPSYYDGAVKKIDEIPEDSILNKINIKQIAENLKQIDLGKYINIETLGSYAKGIINIANAILDIFVTLIISIYTLLERKQILEFFKKVLMAILKNDTYVSIGKYLKRTNEIFFKFLSGQILDSIIIWILISIAMLIMKVRYGVLLAFMIGLFNLIPFLGAIIAVTAAIIITVITGGISQAICVAIVVIILQQIDANIINPKIIGTSLQISPILVILSVSLIGSYFGILGMFLAVPIVTVFKLILMDYIDFKNEKNLHNKNISN